MTSIEQKINELLILLKNEKSQVREIEQQNEELKSRIWELTRDSEEEDIEELRDEVERLEDKVDDLQEKVEDLEADLRTYRSLGKTANEVREKLEELEGQLVNEKISDIFDKYPDELTKIIDAHFYYSNGVVLLLSQLETSA